MCVCVHMHTHIYTCTHTIKDASISFMKLAIRNVFLIWFHSNSTSNLSLSLSLSLFLFLSLSSSVSTFTYPLMMTEFYDCKAINVCLNPKQATLFVFRDGDLM